MELTEARIVSAVQEIRSQAPGLGAYKLFLILQETFSQEMPGRDAFYRIMHENRLMLKPEKRRHTTNSNHNYRKYKNLVKGFKPSGVNQLWVADITYIETDEGVTYLHLLTDAFTHEIIGWVLSDSLVATNTLSALDMAIASTRYMGLENLIHHSDRGSQYCCNAYVERLISIHATISMTEDYKPTDNAIAERVNGIIKQEWIYRMSRYKNKVEAQRSLEKIIDFYNNKRPHMNNEGMLAPRRFREMLTMA